MQPPPSAGKCARQIAIGFGFAQAFWLRATRITFDAQLKTARLVLVVLVLVSRLEFSVNNVSSTISIRL